MISRVARARSGITLTEILISILIMGVGLISLATLFPLGLLRLREATRSSRSGLTFETAANDMDARALFFKPTFMQTWYWTLNNNQQVVPRDPFVQDAINASINGVLSSSPVAVDFNNKFTGRSTVNGLPLLQNGLPICYDPLWRSITGVVPNTALADNSLDFQAGYAVAASDARFGAGVFAGSYPYLRDDPTPGNATKIPSAWGLQRITNFIPWSSANYTPQYAFTCQNLALSPANQPGDVSGLVFASNDDIVFNSFSGNPNLPSPLVPDMSVTVGTNPTPQADYRFTWFVTGRQVDAGGNGMQFTGEVVVCDGRPFGFDPVPGQAFKAPAGETVVEAIFGYGANFPQPLKPQDFSTSTRTVLLRWPSTLPDPQVRAGGWICDVTYEPGVDTFSKRILNTGTTFARCYWYQIGKRTEPQADPSLAGYRSMVVTTTSPVRDQTLLNTNDGSPVHLNAALVMPSVINVFPRAFEVH